MSAYTSGSWRAKPGREQEFVEAWHDLAEWSTVNYDPAGWAKLLRDPEDPLHFVSVGEWHDQRTVDEARASDGFRERFDRIGDLADEMEIRNFDLATEIGRVPV